MSFCLAGKIGNNEVKIANRSDAGLEHETSALACLYGGRLSTRLPGGGGGGGAGREDFYLKGAGMLVGNFELNH